ncbi:unnamed protein product [Amoebophrya sp. A120]|nr:unnamed protein product [Amoebophrya sp. A120]|eukprot:GSA120T00015611001.1
MPLLQEEPSSSFPADLRDDVSAERYAVDLEDLAGNPVTVCVWGHLVVRRKQRLQTSTTAEQQNSTTRTPATTSLHGLNDYNQTKLLVKRCDFERLLYIQHGIPACLIVLFEVDRETGQIFLPEELQAVERRVGTRKSRPVKGKIGRGDNYSSEGACTTEQDEEDHSTPREGGALGKGFYEINQEGLADFDEDDEFACNSDDEDFFKGEEDFLSDLDNEDSTSRTDEQSGRTPVVAAGGPGDGAGPIRIRQADEDLELLRDEQTNGSTQTQAEEGEDLSDYIEVYGPVSPAVLMPRRHLDDKEDVKNLAPPGWYTSTSSSSTPTSSILHGGGRARGPSPSPTSTTASSFVPPDRINYVQDLDGDFLHSLLAVPEYLEPSQDSKQQKAQLFSSGSRRKQEAAWLKMAKKTAAREMQKSGRRNHGLLEERRGLMQEPDAVAGTSRDAVEEQLLHEAAKRDGRSKTDAYRLTSTSMDGSTVAAQLGKAPGRGGNKDAAGARACSNFLPPPNNKSSKKKYRLLIKQHEFYPDGKPPGKNSRLWIYQAIVEPKAGPPLHQRPLVNTAGTSTSAVAAKKLELESRVDFLRAWIYQREMRKFADFQARLVQANELAYNARMVAVAHEILEAEQNPENLNSITTTPAALMNFREAEDFHNADNLTTDPAEVVQRPDANTTASAGAGDKEHHGGEVTALSKKSSVKINDPLEAQRLANAKILARDAQLQLQQSLHYSDRYLWNLWRTGFLSARTSTPAQFRVKRSSAIATLQAFLESSFTPPLMVNHCDRESGSSLFQFVCAEDTSLARLMIRRRVRVVRRRKKTPATSTTRRTGVAAGAQEAEQAVALSSSLGREDDPSTAGTTDVAGSSRPHPVFSSDNIGMMINFNTGGGSSSSGPPPVPPFDDSSTLHPSDFWVEHGEKGQLFCRNLWYDGAAAASSSTTSRSRCSTTTEPPVIVTEIVVETENESNLVRCQVGPEVVVSSEVCRRGARQEQKDHVLFSTEFYLLSTFALNRNDKHGETCLTVLTNEDLGLEILQRPDLDRTMMNMKTSSGRTCFSRAAQLGFKRLCFAILAHKSFDLATCDVANFKDAKSPIGKSGYMIARSKGMSEVCAKIDQMRKDRRDAAIASAEGESGSVLPVDGVGS